MPKYKYTCVGCNNEFFEIVEAGVESTECPECGRTATKHPVTNFGTRYKGEGFYSTKGEQDESNS